MPDLVRFGVSLEKELLAKFDKHIKEKNYPTRSKAIGDLIRESLVKREWVEGREVVGAITLVYNRLKRELVNRLTDVQHDFHHIIISSQHIHLDENNCLEIVVVKGKPKQVERLAYKLRSTKGVKHGSLTMATTGKGIS
jgi:CopG family nickel-responsive transcriptional regulator